ncbi:hypothetical protein HDU97_003558 [Phlyctochytrium planicorne]|nr:hypothetical protein HDU97_003558 [Phlyctochytrium planicorne]
MPVLKGSCACEAVTFTFTSLTPYPYMHCYCLICSKTAGSGGYAINIMGQRETLKVEGSENILVYRHKMTSEESKTVESKNLRNFCRHCSTPLYCIDEDYPNWFWPFAGTIDTPLPRPPVVHHIFLTRKHPFVDLPIPKSEKLPKQINLETLVDGESYEDESGVVHVLFKRYPNLSIQSYHENNGLLASS